MKHELKNLNVFEVGIVDRAANGKKFLAIKSDQPRYAVIEGLQKAIEGDEEAFNYFLKAFAEKATPEQMEAVGFVAKSVEPVAKDDAPADEDVVVNKDDEQPTGETTETPDVGAKEEPKEEEGEVLKAVNELTEMVVDMASRLEKAESTLGSLRNVTKATGEGVPPKAPVAKATAEKTEDLSDEVSLNIRKRKSRR